MEAATIVKSVLCGLHEIQPAVSMMNMPDETRAIEDMKIGLRKLLLCLDGQKNQDAGTEQRCEQERERMQKLIASSGEDVMGHAASLAGLMFAIESSDMENDEIIRTAILAAESFALRARDYLQNKMLVEAMYG